jgi:hypothetical protein
MFSRLLQSFGPFKPKTPSLLGSLKKPPGLNGDYSFCGKLSGS